MLGSLSKREEDLFKENDDSHLKVLIQKISP
jgi:hypothetical protein